MLWALKNEILGICSLDTMDGFMFFLRSKQPVWVGRIIWYTKQPMSAVCCLTRTTKILQPELRNRLTRTAKLSSSQCLVLRRFSDWLVTSSFRLERTKKNKKKTKKQCFHNYSDVWTSCQIFGFFVFFGFSKFCIPGLIQINPHQFCFIPSLTHPKQWTTFAFRSSQLPPQTEN